MDPGRTSREGDGMTVTDADLERAPDPGSESDNWIGMRAAVRIAQLGELAPNAG